MGQRARTVGFLGFILSASLMACAPAMTYKSLPCPDSPPDTRVAANETPPRVRSFMVESAASRWEAYFLIEPSGSVNPDSVMVCGVNVVTTRDKVAKGIAAWKFVPATRDGRPVRHWFHMIYGDTQLR